MKPQPEHLEKLRLKFAKSCEANGALRKILMVGARLTASGLTINDEYYLQYTLEYLKKYGLPLHSNFEIDAMDIFNNNENFLHIDSHDADVILICYVMDPDYSHPHDANLKWRDAAKRTTAQVIVTVVNSYGIEISPKDFGADEAEKEFEKRWKMSPFFSYYIMTRRGTAAHLSGHEPN